MCSSVLFIQYLISWLYLVFLSISGVEMWHKMKMLHFFTIKYYQVELNEALMEVLFWNKYCLWDCKTIYNVRLWILCPSFPNPSQSIKYLGVCTRDWISSPRQLSDLFSDSTIDTYLKLSTKSEVCLVYFFSKHSLLKFIVPVLLMSSIVIIILCYLLLWMQVSKTTSV